MIVQIIWYIKLILVHLDISKQDLIKWQNMSTLVGPLGVTITENVTLPAANYLVFVQLCFYLIKK